MDEIIKEYFNKQNKDEKTRSIKKLLFELNNEIVFVPDSKYTVSIYA